LQIDISPGECRP